MDTNELIVYSVKVNMPGTSTFRVRVFSNIDAEETLREYYHDMFFMEQPDITQYTVTKIAPFKDTDQLAIALRGYEYADKYQS